MRVFIDCEYNEFKGELISMALVSEDGREWYESLGCDKPGAWVAEHVMPIIGITQVDKESFQASLEWFLEGFDAVHLVADWPEDIAHFCQALITGPGERISTPPLTMEVLRVDAPSRQPHNALADARGLREFLL